VNKGPNKFKKKEPKKKARNTAKTREQTSLGLKGPELGGPYLKEWEWEVSGGKVKRRERGAAGCQLEGLGHSMGTPQTKKKKKRKLLHF